MSGSRRELDQGDISHAAVTLIDPEFGVGGSPTQWQEQKTVAGATRTIIFANDSLRTKEWDKATGVFTNSSETFKNWSSHVYMTATNMWCTQIMGIDQTTFFTTVTLIVVTAAVVLALTIAVAVKKNKLSNS